MVIETSVACAIGAVMAVKTMRRHDHDRHSQRRKQLLIQVLGEAKSDLSTIRNPHLSDRRFEMELLLMQLGAKAEMLMEALATEVKVAEKANAEDTEGPSALEQWRSARSAVEQAQEDYTEALDEYGEFLHTLPPPLRANAVERGAFAMAIKAA